MKSVDGRVYVTAEEMGRIDRIAIEEFGIDVLSLMENAGVATAVAARRLMGGRIEGKRLQCLIGKGNNGGDGLVAARHLHNWGADVSVVLCDRSAMAPVPSMQVEMVEKMGIPVKKAGTSLAGSELLIDGMLGYNSKGNPREPIAGMIRDANESLVPVLAVDIPSGLDATTGEPNEPCIVATATLTLGFPKTGFLNPRSRRFVGELYLGDISIPMGIYKRYSQDVSLFGGESVVRIQ